MPYIREEEMTMQEYKDLYVNNIGWSLISDLKPSERSFFRDDERNKIWEISLYEKEESGKLSARLEKIEYMNQKQKIMKSFGL